MQDCRDERQDHCVMHKCAFNIFHERLHRSINFHNISLRRLDRSRFECVMHFKDCPNRNLHVRVTCVVHNVFSFNKQCHFMQHVLTWWTHVMCLFVEHSFFRQQLVNNSLFPSWELVVPKKKIKDNKIFVPPVQQDGKYKRFLCFFPVCF